MAKVAPFVVEIESLLNSVREGCAAAVSAEDGYAAVDMAQRVTEAVQSQDSGLGITQAAEG